MKEAILVGGFHEIVELCELCGVNLIGVIDKNIKNTFLSYLGSDDDAPRLFEKYKSVPLIVTPDLPETRKKITTYYTSIGFSFLSLISPKAEISKSCVIEEGSIIQSGATVSSNAQIGPFVKINTNATIMHDCKIGAYVTVAPSAVVLGRAVIHGESYIGANATILPNVSVGKGAVVGAGAVVTKNVEPNTVVMGTAAQ